MTNPRSYVIVIEALPSGQIHARGQGTLTPAEIVFGIEILKAQILSKMIQEPTLPGVPLPAFRARDVNN